MKSLVQWLLFLLIVAIASGALLFAIYMGKEGFGPIWLPAVIAGFLGVLLFGWRLLHSTILSRRGFYWLGVLSLAIPFSLHALFALYGSYLWAGGQLWVARARIIEYRETPIRWPGLQEPVGVRLELVTAVPVKLPGIFHSPRIILGQSERASDTSDPWPCHSTPGTQACFIEPIGLMRSPAVVSEAAATRLSFDLYSSNIDYLNPHSRVCLLTNSISATKHIGTRRIRWRFATEGGIIVDLSPLLEEVVAKRGQLLDDENLLRMNRVLSVETLKKLGYDQCPATAVPGSTCYCR